MLNLRKKLSNVRTVANILLLTAGGVVAAGVKDSKKAETFIKQIGEKAAFTDEKGVIDIGGACITLVIAAITMGIGAMICGKIFPNIVGSDEASNQTIAEIQATTWDAISLLPLALLVFGAVVIVGVVMYLRQ